MAKMIPSGLPEAFRRENYDGERVVWHALQKQLPDEFSVLWSISTIGQDQKRELDYLVLHPNFGLLAIEVKGGIVEVGNPYERHVKWTVHTRQNRRTDTINNPYDQVMGASMALIRNWKARSPFSGRYPVSQMVVLPHTPRSQTAIDNLRDLAGHFVFENDMAQLGRIAADRMAVAITEKPGLEPISEGGVQSVIDIYGNQHTGGINYPPFGGIPVAPEASSALPHRAPPPPMAPAARKSAPGRLQMLGAALLGALVVLGALGTWIWSGYPFEITDHVEEPSTPVIAPAKKVAATDNKPPAKVQQPQQKPSSSTISRGRQEGTDPPCKPYVEPLSQGNVRTGIACKDASGNWIIRD